jgi:hypothetical protein
MRQPIRRIVVTAALTTLLAGSPAGAAGLSGAIFTTNAQGTWVNGNVYGSASDVYLNGGPRVNQNCSAAGLPDGAYVFQVTDPSGHMMLSELPDTARVFEVAGGVISDYGGVKGDAYGRCGGLTVQLAPFLATPNAGGEYKVWVTPHDEIYEIYGFIPSRSKTDNFKVQPSDGGGDPD